MAQVRQIISQLDRAPKMLLISVFQGTAGELRSLGVVGHINYQYRRDGKVSDMAGSSASLKLLGSTSHHANQATQQLRVVDGGEGYIETGESLPMVFHGYRTQLLSTSENNKI